MSKQINKDLIHQLAELKAKRIRYEQDNRIEFFGIVDPSRGMKGANPLQIKLLEAWNDPKYKVFTYSGANRIGKTTIGIIIALCTLFGKWMWNNEPLKFSHKEPRKIRIIGQDWEKHIQKVIEPELKKWFPKNRSFTTRKNNFGVDAFWIDDETKSSLEIMSNNQESDLHEGWNGDLILYDEPPKRDIRVANARGLIDRQGRELFCMTLLKEGWIHREVVKALLHDGSPDLSVFNVYGDIYQNIGYGITKEGIEQFAKTLTDEEKQARLFGVPSYLSGLVYPKFDRQIHCKKIINKIPLDWIIDIAIDFHPSKKWAVLFMATDNRNFKYVIDEIWVNGSWKYICDEIVRRVKTYNLRMGNIIIDPLSKGDAQSDLNEESVFEKMQTYLMRYGLSLHLASKDKDGGIHIINTLLMSDNEMPSLFFFNKCVRTIQEIESYIFDPDTGKPQKVDDDMMENLYRLGLLNTQWYEIEDNYEDEIVDRNVKGNAITGY